MKKIISGLLAATLSASFAAMAVPANAAQVFVPQAQSATSDVQTIQYRPWMRHRDGGTSWNGYRGYRDYHPGYRRHGDYWFPLAAFAAGALITGAIVNSENGAYRGDAHVQWCYDHYRSYRAYDNTYLGSGGVRRECRSPY
ncbi:BA14K family protein [Mesorhizobium sp.]|uniref:BA14K family protein n=1 Tax=Mesorhizobium sp. TaxID=1871066 RepID=UPI0025ED2CA1|nr:BA14K family protein [Mesorhizobium sp.]